MTSSLILSLIKPLPLISSLEVFMCWRKTTKMVLSKSYRVWRKYRPRSVLLESRDVPDHVLLFESDVIASLSKHKFRLAS